MDIASAPLGTRSDIRAEAKDIESGMVKGGTIYMVTHGVGIMGTISEELLSA